MVRKIKISEPPLWFFFFLSFYVVLSHFEVLNGYFGGRCRYVVAGDEQDSSTTTVVGDSISKDERRLQESGN